MENYEYVTKKLDNPKIAQIYKTLGPFDYTLFEPIDEDNFDLDAGIRSNEDRSEASSIPGNSSRMGASSAAGGQPHERSRIFQDYWETRPSGAIYKGDVQEMKKRPDGRGIKIHNKKSLYEGYWVDGKAHGYGRGINSLGEVYQGMFNQDCMDGEGFYYWPDGRIFEGTFADGKKQGKGRFFWPNGQVYDGEFKYDDCNGAGTLYYPDGKRFEGSWKEGNKHGKGTYVFPNG